MENESFIEKFISNNPILWIAFGEISVYSLFYLFAKLFSCYPNLYVLSLFIAHAIFPLGIRTLFDDRAAFDDLFDDFLTGIMVGGIALLLTGVELKLFLPNRFITTVPDGDLKFIGMFYAVQKLSMELVKVYTSSKEYRKNYRKSKNKELMIVISSKKDKETN